MQKVTRVLLIVAGAILGIAIVALLAVNLYVQSHSTQARIQDELSARLGATLRIQRISVTPWGGLKLTGITMPQKDAAVRSEFLKADAFRLRIRFSSLFSGRLVIKEVALVHPNVVWVQNANGKWRLPGSESAADESAAPVASAPIPAAPALVPSSAARAAMTAAAPPAPPQQPVPQEVQAEGGFAGEERPFTPEIRRVNLRDGNFHFLDADGRPVATFEGVDFRSNFRNATALRGDASIAKISLRDRFFLEQLDSPLKYDPDELDLSEISAKAAGGEITGRFNMRPNDPESPFSLSMKFTGLEANRIVTDASGPEDMIHGQLEGSLEATGNTADPNALSGTGEIFLRDGQVRQYSLLTALGQLLQIDELKQLKFDQAHVKYHITPGLVTVDELILSSPNIRLSAVGTITFQGKLRLDSQLAINEKIHGQLFQPIAQNFQPMDPQGFAALNFRVTGTVDKPKTNLMDKLVGPDLKDLGGVLNSLLGGGRSDRAKKKKKAPEDAALAAPADAALGPPAPADPAPPAEANDPSSAAESEQPPEAQPAPEEPAPPAEPSATP